jgi:UDP-2-acetamido-3-amino-2,3-dideoxy-glucuronate N-acetyltransferase
MDVRVSNMKDDEFFAHETAIVESGAVIGSGSRFWHHSHVRSGSTIGQDCIVGKNVYIDTGAVVGDRCKIQNNVSVFHGVLIGDDVFVGPSATFTNDLVPRAFNADWKITRTEVSDGASIGANATIVCGTKLGRYCMVAAGATVTKDVPAYQLVAGTPARPIGWVCTCGSVVSREQSPPADPTCRACREKSKK